MDVAATEFELHQYCTKFIPESGLHHKYEPVGFPPVIGSSLNLSCNDWPTAS